MFFSFIGAAVFEDFAPLNSSSSSVTLTFSETITSFDLNFEVIDDSLFERLEAFRATLTIPDLTFQGVGLGTIVNLRVEIVDDEGVLNLNVHNSVVTVSSYLCLCSHQCWL